MSSKLWWVWEMTRFVASFYLGSCIYVNIFCPSSCANAAWLCWSSVSCACDSLIVCWWCAKQSVVVGFVCCSKAWNVFVEAAPCFRVVGFHALPAVGVTFSLAFSLASLVPLNCSVLTWLTGIVLRSKLRKLADDAIKLNISLLKTFLGHDIWREMSASRWPTVIAGMQNKTNDGGDGMDRTVSLLVS